MMASMAHKIQALFPDSNTPEDWVVSVDANGVESIKRWNLPDPQPTQAQLDAVTDQQAADAVDNERIRQNFEVSKRDKVLIRWIAQKTNTSIADAKAELKAIWDSTN